MLIFIFNGITSDELLNIIDGAISSTDYENTGLMVWSMGYGTSSLDVDCFDTETGKRTSGAEALASFFNLRKKELEGRAKSE